MKKIGSWISILSVAVALAACGQDNGNEAENNSTAEETQVETLDVTLDTPEKVEKGEKVTFTATVTQGEEKVDDADEVMFEVWKEGSKEESEMIEASHDGDGVYSGEKQLDEAGKYFVQSHVTARDLHTMPKNEIMVGSEEEAASESHEHEHEHESDVSIHLMKPEEMKVNEEVSLMAHLQKDDAALTGADVRYEISKVNEEKAEWVDAKEMKDGEYEATTSFKDAGDYTVTIHVENDEGLHEHTEEKVTISE
ncbi:FixH family protein [Bacillus sp. RAR_GA_16]|uniref:FixH family protein n=1 Tax=Bacillus sp. RAR_GA_16 TaxID=2876774 RepID=UPI001CC90483|nr:FixH family protein [Bacillus sp. RAR_GA_16]MCA0173231.1 FixH family protein [Bacillus sp. RAR_GA_16]